MGSDEGGDDDDEPVARMGEFRRTRRQLAELKAELREIKERDTTKANEAFMAEVAALKAYKAEAEATKVKEAKEAIRRKNADAILAGVAEAQRADVALMLSGMQLDGKINLYDEAEGAGLKLREQLAKDRPGWFTTPPNGGGLGAMTGTPGQGLPSGPLTSLPPEQFMQLPDKQLAEHFATLHKPGAVRL